MFPLCTQVLMMQVTIRLHGVFRIDRFKEESRHYPDSSTVQDVVDELALPDHILGIILINDQHSTVDTSLNDGDILALLPILEGG